MISCVNKFVYICISNYHEHYRKEYRASEGDTSGDYP